MDPGGDIDLLLSKVKRSGMKLEKILLTHAHLDHVGGAKSIADQLDVPIIGPHEDDTFWFEMLPKQAEMFGFEPLQAFLPDQWLEAGMSVNVGNEVLSVFHCPGHTPGHIVFLNEKTRLAFVGDVLFKGSIGRTDFPGGDYATLISSIKETCLPLGDDVVFIPGHGPISSFGSERMTNPFLTD